MSLPPVLRDSPLVFICPSVCLSVSLPFRCQLRYVEYERRKLPPALLEASEDYTSQVRKVASRDGGGRRRDLGAPSSVCSKIGRRQTFVGLGFPQRVCWSVDRAL